MIKELRKKFIFTAMISVTVLLVGLLAALNILSYSYMNKHADMILELIADSYNNNPVQYESADPSISNTDKGTVREGVPEPPDSDGESSGDQEDPDMSGSFAVPPPEGEITVVTPVTIQFSLMNSDVSMNDVFRSAYFTVTMDSEGEFIYTDLSRIASVSSSQAQAEAEKIFNSGKKKGWDGKLKYLVSEDAEGNSLFIFLEREPEITSQTRLALFSALIAIACLAIMSVFVALISRRMLQPIVVNMELQKNFVTNASHELKTPLAVIQSNTEALELYNGENKWTKNIKEQIKNLSALLNNMLTLARAQEDTGMKKEAIDISAVLRDFVNTFTEPAVQKDVIFNTRIEDRLIIKGTKAQTGQLVSIILGNALKYCDPGTVIDVDAFSKDRDAVIKVSDTCSELPECEPERLFERFYRPETTRYSNKSGNGIGLSAARAITESFGGKIICTYESENRIMFTITIRKA